MPTLFIVAGPNGAGKSTVAASLVGTATIVNPDQFNSPKQAIRLRRKLAAEGKDFAIETTLSGKAMDLRWIDGLRSSGYKVRLWFLYLSSEDLAVERVRLRVLAGGHSVPEADIRRRYQRGLANLMRFLAVANKWQVLDNSDWKRMPVAEFSSGTQLVHDPSLWRIIQDRTMP